jgi:hypothetical protein
MNRVFTTAAVALWLGIAVRGQEAPETISVHGFRPLGEATLVIQKRCGCRITYEDSAKVQTGALVFTTRLRPGDSDPDAVLSALLDMVAAYAQAGYPLAYRVVHTDGVFHVVPQHSILDVLITAHLSGVTVAEALDQVLAMVKAAGGADIKRGGIGTLNQFRQTRVQVDADNRPARDVLIMILAQAPARAFREENGREVRFDKPWSWQLFRDYYGDVDYAVLNLVAVP